MADNKDWLEKWRAEYNKYLNSPEWQAKREAVFAWKGRVCTAQLEGCTGEATSVHHTGEGYKMAFDTPLFHLEPVCWPCHMQIEKAKRTAKQRRSDLQDVWRERQKQSAERTAKDQKLPRQTPLQASGCDADRTADAERGQ